MEMEYSSLYADRAFLLAMQIECKPSEGRDTPRHITERDLGGGGRKTNKDIERHTKTQT